MKIKRIVSALLCLCMALVLQPGTALAAAPSQLFVAGTNVINGNNITYWKAGAETGRIEATTEAADDWVVKYDPTQSIAALTLRGATLYGVQNQYRGAGIYYDSGDLALILEGASTIVGASIDDSSDNCSGIVVYDCSISGTDTDTLNITANSNAKCSLGIWAHSLNMTGGTVTAATIDKVGGSVDDYYRGRGVIADSITVSGGSLTGTAVAHSGDKGVYLAGIYAEGAPIVVNGSGSIIGIAGNASSTTLAASDQVETYGVYANHGAAVSGNGSIFGRAGIATAPSSLSVKSCGVWAWSDYTLSIADQGSIMGSAAESSKYSYGVYSSAPISMTGGSLLAQTSAVTAPTKAGVYKLSHTNPTNYAWRDGVSADWQPGTPSTPTQTYVEIQPRIQLTVSGTTVGNKNYDGNLTATVTLGSVSNVLAGDGVSVEPTGAFDTKNAGMNKAVTVTYSLSGGAAARYIAPAGETQHANIDPIPLTVTDSTAANKQYDGNTTAAVTLGTVSGIVAGDEVTITPTGNFDTKEVGEHKPVTITYALSGANAGNYTAPQNDTAYANITAAPVTTCTVAYAPNGGTGTMQNGTANAGVPFTLSSCGFIAPTGRQFKEWAIGSTDGAKVAAGGSYTFTEDTDVYAIWENAPIEVVPVTNILRGFAQSVAVNTDLPLAGTVEPSNATNKTIVWSLKNAGATGAAVTSDGVFHAASAGTATVTATITDGRAIGTPYTQDYTIQVSATPVTTYTISVSASPTVGGTVSGGGTYNENASVIVRATANSGYRFVKWMEGGTQYSTNANYTFTVTGTRTLVAVFETDTPTPPTPPAPFDGSSSSGGSAYIGNTYPGAWSGSALTVQADKEKCIGVAVDNKPLTIGTDCTLTSGSTIVAFTPSFLATLKDGTHTIRVQFTDGRYNGTFTTPLSASIATAAIPNVPATGGAPWRLLPLALFILAGEAYRRRRAEPITHYFWRCAFVWRLFFYGVCADKHVN